MSKKKGSRLERELLHIFFQNDWHCIRVAGSGSTTELSTDLLAGKNGRVLAIECKGGKGRRYLDEEQLIDLEEFAKKFGAEAWIGTRFDNNEWLFLKKNQLEKSKGGVPYIDIELAKRKGLDFKKLIDGKT